MINLVRVAMLKKINYDDAWGNLVFINEHSLAFSINKLYYTFIFLYYQ